MNLLTAGLIKRFKDVGDQDVKDPIVIAKFFTPWSNWTWYATAYTPDNGIFFGLVEGIETELGYFALSDLKGVIGPMGLKIERDLNFKEQLLSEITNKNRGICND